MYINLSKIPNDIHKNWLTLHAQRKWEKVDSEILKKTYFKNIMFKIEKNMLH